ncbi:MAG TPA: PQQ-dependent sugar dehydrogenase [Candidatus Krumholzibacteria bacterium]|nr:PQQ-dependent sugar dehydrogenase [Candidatus Krumholzibacteria bacterium]
MRYLPVVIAMMLAGALPVRAEYQLERAFPSITFTYPTDVQSPDDGSNRIFVTEKTGMIRCFTADFNAQPGDVHEFLNLTGKVRSSGEAGLLGLAFHPQYKNNGVFFVYYVSNFPYRCVLARYHVTADPSVADPASEEILIDLPQATVFHNGGQIAFGPDGLLYIGIGEDLSGPAAQDLTDLRGSILRIDVDVPGGIAMAPMYEVPVDNPFVGNTSGYREEIYAYGFRNPWRFSIDHYSGELWVADVGEDTYEEIDLVTKGGNYGWPYLEGPACLDAIACASEGPFADPFYYYDHSEGIAVIGGQRYWGRHTPELAGLYIFADYAGGKVWALRYDGAGTAERFDLVLNAPTLLTFGTGPNRELYVASVDGYLYRIGRTVTQVGDHGAPAGNRLLGNYPNPFNPATTIRYALSAPGHVVIEVVSVTGERVQRIDDGMRAAGAHDTVWRGETSRGGRAASGVYFYRLVVDGRSFDARRLVLVE